MLNLVQNEYRLRYPVLIVYCNHILHCCMVQFHNTNCAFLILQGNVLQAFTAEEAQIQQHLPMYPP